MYLTSLHTPSANAMDRLCLRKTALRVLRSPALSIPARSRSITTLNRSNPHFNATRTVAPSLQRRWASEDLTQPEPPADQETEAEHGDNSTAKSSDGSASEIAPVESSDQSDSATVTEAVKSAANTATNKAAEATNEAAAAASSAASHLTGSSSQAKEDPPQPAQGTSKTVYVGNLFFDVDEAALEKEFSQAGKVTNVKVIRDGRGQSKGYTSCINTFLYDADVCDAALAT